MVPILPIKIQSKTCNRDFQLRNSSVRPVLVYDPSLHFGRSISLFSISNDLFPSQLILVITGDNVCAVQWWVCSTVVDAKYSGGLSSVQWRDIISTVEGAKYSGGISSVQWRVIISTVEGAKYSGGISSVQWRMRSTVEGYHQYSGGIATNL